MKLIIFFIHWPFVYSELHKFVTTYAAIRGLNNAEDEFFAATTLDGQQIGYYDNNQTKIVPKQDWMKRIESEGLLKENTLISENVQQIYSNTINDLMQQMHQSNGVHTYQGMFGCSWEDNTGFSHVFHYYGFDGEDFVTLDVKKSIFTASVSQAKPIVEKWNKNKEHIQTLIEYYEYECVYWMREFLFSTKAAFEKTEPKVSLLQKNPGADVKCHVTGFYLNTSVIQWRKNGQVINSNALVKSGTTLPNNDGTFQKTVTLSVSPDDWKEEQYTCAVKHMGKTIQKILTEKEIIRKHNSSTSVPVDVICLIVVAIIAVFALILWDLYHLKTNYKG